MYGRRVIYSDVDKIDYTNVVDVLNEANAVHAFNLAEIQVLDEYYRGKQKIANRTKTIRPEINNKITENRANEIVSFKTGYLLEEPIQYVARKGKEKYIDSINQLNDYMYLEDNESNDKELIDWMHICGTSYKMALPRENPNNNEAPFCTYVLNPKTSYVIYSSALGHKALAGVKFIYNEEEKKVYSVWTDDWYYEIVDGEIKNEYHFENQDGIVEVFKGEPHFGMGIPIIEYPANKSRLGAFEIVIDILDAINMVASNRVDAIEQFVQSLMLFCNCDIDEQTFKELKELGALKYKSDSTNPAKVEILTSELNQMQTQTLVDYMYDTVLTICGMPNRNGGSSTSDTGSAVIMRDGWSAAETRAKNTETAYKKSEKKFLKLILSYINDSDEKLDLPLTAIKINFTRRNYENITQKSQVLISMLNCPKIHPLLAFIQCNMFPNPEEAYEMSMEYYQEQLEKENGNGGTSGGNNINTKADTKNRINAQA